MRRVACALLILLVGCSILSAGPGLEPWAGPSLAAPLGSDEFGRDLLVVVLVSSGRSLALGAGVALVASALAMALALLISVRASMLSRPILLTTQIFESVPILLWVLVAFSALGGHDFLVAGGAFIVAVLPFATTILAGEFERLSKEPFTEAARLCGASDLQIVWRHLLPNSRAVLAPLFIQILGLAAAVPGAIGVLGFTNRTNQDLGVLLLRGRENVGDHPGLLVSGLAAFVLIYVCLEIARGGFGPRLRAPKAKAVSTLL